VSEIRNQAELQRMIAETAKLNEETRKFVAEQHKLMAEAGKLDRDRWLAPVIAIAAVIGGLLGTAAFIAKVIS
jgi:hypothetical protein